MVNCISNKEKGVFIDLRNGIIQYTTPHGGIHKSRLGKKERDLLLFLIEHKGSIITKNKILEHVWRDRVVCENTASVTLSNIRKIFRKADEDCACLRTVSGVGYVFSPEKSGFVLDCRDMTFDFLSQSYFETSAFV